MLDKILLNSAVLLDIKKETHLTSSWQFTWINSIFYFGYLTGTPIHVYFLQHVPLNYYVSGIVTFWGVVVGLHAACEDYSKLLTIRYFLGLFESAITPGLILMTGRFYTRREQMVRTAIWFHSMDGHLSLEVSSRTGSYVKANQRTSRSGKSFTSSWEWSHSSGVYFAFVQCHQLPLLQGT